MPIPAFEKQTVEGKSSVKYEPAEFLKGSTEIICRVPLKQDQIQLFLAKGSIYLCWIT